MADMPSIISAIKVADVDLGETPVIAEVMSCLFMNRECDGVMIAVPAYS
jgi:hypothetical protein